MIRASFTLLLTLLLMAAGGLWLLGELDREDAARLVQPRLHSVDLDTLREEALETLRDVARSVGGESTAEPAMEEVALPEPAPFVESPLPERAADPAPPPEVADPPDEPIVVAARDQDAWAALIRRMLALYRRAGGR